MLQALPLDIKILKTKLRIREWVSHHGGWDEVYVSFSGGKDSTVLADIAAQVCAERGKELTLMFVDTGLEYPEIKEFVPHFAEWLRNKYDIKVRVDTVKPKMSFFQVVKEYGFPLVSKETAKNIYYGRRAKRLGNEKMYNTYINGHRLNKKTGKSYIHMPLPKCWMPLFESDIPVSNKCCQIMKKDPAKHYEKETGRHPFTGEMADDSRERETQYLQTSCNAFDAKRPISKPLGFWREKDVLLYLRKYKIPIASVYGDIKLQGGKLHTTGFNRTGCWACAFGIHLQDEPNKFQQMKTSHPKLWNALKKVGLFDILDFLEVKYE